MIDCTSVVAGVGTHAMQNPDGFCMADTKKSLSYATGDSKICLFCFSRSVYHTAHDCYFYIQMIVVFYHLFYF